MNRKTLSATIILPLSIAATFLSGCEMDNADSDAISARAKKLEQQASEYSLKHDDKSALRAVSEALTLKPNDIGLLEFKVVLLWNLFCEHKSPDELLAFCNDHISRKIEPEVMFRLMKAQVFQELGTRYDEDYSVVIVDREQCLAAISELEIAINLEPNIAALAKERDWLPMGLEEHFDGLKDFPEFQALGK